MSRYIDYNPDQARLLPPSAREELGEAHLPVFVHELVAPLEMSRFEATCAEDGRPAYPPQMMLKLWLYTYAQGMTSSRRLEQRIREDLGFRLLAGSLKPACWARNQFRRRHGRAINDVFTQVWRRRGGLGWAG